MGSSGQTIICPKPRRDARRRLFCFPHAGVGPSAFRGWADDLPCNAEVCFIQLPGREGRLRETPASSITSLMPALVESVGPLLDLPFAFYGHSLGATIAFELALHLRRALGPQPSHFFVGASPAPQLPWPHPPIRSLPENDFFGALQGRYGALPREVIGDVEMRALVLPILRADVTMIETYAYSPESPLNSDLTVFGGLRDEMVRRHELESWREQTAGRFRLEMLDGDHLFLKSRRAELLQLVASELNSCCERASAGSDFDATRT
jgi:medium-chain acyl-[acyl-carrier-protein] hydrolase